MITKLESQMPNFSYIFVKFQPYFVIKILQKHFFDFYQQQVMHLIVFNFIQIFMETEKQIQQYLNAHVNPVFSQMLVDIIKQRPRNILNFCKSWCQKKIQFHRTITHIDSDSEEDDIVDDLVIQLKRQSPKAQERRNGVSGYNYSMENIQKVFEPKFIKKKTSVNNRILFRLKSTFLFNQLSDTDTSILINAMQENIVQAGKYIIQQGEIGDEVYILDEGELQCFKIDPKTQQRTLEKDIKQGEIFGELSLMYNIPRTANIVAKKKSLIFKLDRKTFNHVIRKKNITKRQVYCTAIDQVDIFRELTQSQRDKLQDIVRQMNIHSNQYVIRQGRVGNKFYIIQKGQLVALKKNANGHQTVVYQYKQGDYFGQLSLISNKARAASIMSLSSSRLLYIEREAFQRIIGPMENILQRNHELYAKYTQKNLFSDQ